MATASEEILARYKETVTEVDKFGRSITLGRIRPAQELAVLRMLETQDRSNQLTFLAVASVRRIDAINYPAARTIGEIEAVINLLDEEGLTAVGIAYAKLKGAKAEELPKTADEAKADLKNA